MAKYIKRSWGSDLVLDRNFLLTVIIMLSIIFGAIFIGQYGHNKICQTHNPILILVDQIFLNIVILLGMLGGGPPIPTPSC